MMIKDHFQQKLLLWPQALFIKSSRCTPLHGILYFLLLTMYFLCFLYCTYLLLETYATSMKSVERILQKFLKRLSTAVWQRIKLQYLEPLKHFFIILRMHYFHEK